MTAERQDVDVDTRFLLANDRTLLAWLRTALTLLVAGVAVLQLGDGTSRRLAGAALLALAASAAGAGLARYRDADRAVRSGTLPSAGRAPVLLAGAVVGVALAALALGLAGVLDGG